MYRDIPQSFRELVEPVLRDHGLELVDAELARGPGGLLVRVVVDNPSGDGRVPVERCAGVSRELASSLDADPALASGYRLEVSSPGLDRVLGREKDFAAACGGEVRIETRAPVGGRRRFRGALLSFAEGVARVRVDGTVHELPFEAVARAQQVYHYTSADFGGKGAVPAASGEA